MRVLFLADAMFEDIPGGSRVVARELACGLIERGHEITFLVPRHSLDAPDDERRDGARIVRYLGAGQPHTFIQQGQRACSQLWVKQAFDVVHTHFAYAAFGPLRAVPRGVPHVRSFHGPWDKEGQAEDYNRLLNLDGVSMLQSTGITARNELKRLLRRWFEAENLRRSQAVVVLSEYMRNEVLSLNYPRAQIYKTVGGADTKRFVPVQSKRAAKQAICLSPDKQVLLSVRRLVPRMGLDHLIQAMPQVVARCPNIILLIGGKGPEQHRLEQLIAATRMNNYVRLVGFIPDRDLVRYYQAADLFVLPTVALEGFGLVTVEALSSGTPVLGTPIGATPEILEALDPRLITRKPTPEELAKGIITFFNSGWSHELTPAHLHDFVCQHYTWDHQVSFMETLYQNIVAAQ